MPTPLAPVARQRILTDLGVVAPGALLHTYVGGSPSTPLDAYTTAALNVAHANPIVASAGGLFAAIYLTPGVAYKFALTQADATAIWTQDGIVAPYTAGDTIALADGTVALPALTFVTDPDTGVYREGANALALATAGVKAIGIDTTQFIDSPTQPRCLAYNTAVQSLNNATDTPLIFNAESYDVGTLHDVAVNSSRLTVPTGGDGLYLIKATYVIAAASGDVRSFLRKNGTTELEGTAQRGILNAGFQTIWPMLTVVALAAGDYVEAIAYQSSGGALNAGDAGSARFMNTALIVKLW
jgi:hypothetical protein